MRTSKKLENPLREGLLSRSVPEPCSLAQGLVGDSAKSTDVPLNSACTDEEHASMAVRMKL